MIKKHTISIKNAWHGLRWALSTQPNYRIHLFLSLAAIVGGIYFKINQSEFLTIFVLITLGLSIETVNTAIEETTDAIDTKIRPDIGLAKDVAAGAMLVFAIGALFISGIIFLPRIFQILK
ncbi:diacylglycerol kinase family protein [Candidatus Roizmanbacteria bacterium]|nr:diacylglycerol kinase family protein [Candidatus Roizmanbacteria bacterium]